METEIDNEIVTADVGLGTLDTESGGVAVSEEMNNFDHAADGVSAEANDVNMQNDDENDPPQEIAVRADGHVVYAAKIVQPKQIEGDFIAEKPQIIYRLKDYEAPIELLYELIKDAKIEIEDIFISDITSQYVQIINDTPREELDFEYAGEFITMAAELVYLKSVRILPKDDDEEYEEDDAEYERMQLINKIKEYALLKEQSEKLREIETINRFYRAPVYTDKDYRVALVNFSLPKLVEAFAKVLANADRREQEIIPKKVVKERFSVHDQMEYIRVMISVRKEMNFMDLFEPDYDKSDIVTTFLAVLELLKYGRLHATQEETFGTITIFAVEGTEDTPVEFEEGDDGKY